MPDSDWSLIEGDEYLGYENAHDNGQPPKPGFSQQESYSQTDQGDVLIVTTTTTIWENITANPPGQAVSEFCSQCPDHVHTVAGDVPDADQEHVGYLHWGDHRGMRYKNSQLRGIELKREEVLIKIRPTPPAAGPGLGLGLQWQPNREHKLVFWYSHTIDRVVNGVIWRRFDTRPCTDREEYYVSLNQAADRLQSAIGLSITGDGPAPTLVGNEFLGLLRSAARLRNPSFSVSPDPGGHSAGWIITLEDAAKPGHAVRRVRTTVKAGKLRHTGDA